MGETAVAEESKKRAGRPPKPEADKKRKAADDAGSDAKRQRGRPKGSGKKAAKKASPKKVCSNVDDIPVMLMSLIQFTFLFALVQKVVSSYQLNIFCDILLYSFVLDLSECMINYYYPARVIY